MREVDLQVVAELDVPGETARQGRVFQIWLVCLLLAVALVIVRRPDAPATRRQSEQHQQQVAAWKQERWLVALGFGLALPGFLTWWVTHRRRRGGPHARGIQLDITRTGELRQWGRGYGIRVALAGAEVSERLVDVFTGRMGAWRQRRLLVRASRPLPGARATELEVATVATEQDGQLDLRLDGGEGDCVELSRQDFLKLRQAILERAQQDDEPQKAEPEPDAEPVAEPKPDVEPEPDTGSESGQTPSLQTKPGA